MLLDLRDPAVKQVAERAGSDHAVAEQEDIGVLVAQGAETLQFVLSNTRGRHQAVTGSGREPKNDKEILGFTKK